MTKEANIGSQAVTTRTESHPQPLKDSAGYTGYAALGTAEDEPRWLIVRTRVAGTVTYTEYANGRLEYNQKWANRAALTYRR
jgi:hypothetical protein